MSENSKIEWTDSTFNPWEGCQKVGPGCDHCYAETRNARFGGGEPVNWGPAAPRRRTSTANWRKPLQWNARPFFQCRTCGWRGDRPGNLDGFFLCPGPRCASFDLMLVRRRVFCASLADVFDNEVDPAWRRDLFDLIELTPNLDWLLLTKRIGNARRLLPVHDWCIGRDNVWLGATIVNQEEADRDIPKLLATPARVRFLSMEPLLGPVTLRNLPIGGYHEELHFPPEHDRFDALQVANGIDWVIVGGESGPGARPMNIQWARSLRDQCARAGVPYLFKQWGEWLGAHQDGAHDHDPVELNATDGPVRVGKKAAGRHLDGRTHDEFPRGAA